MDSCGCCFSVVGATLNNHLHCLKYFHEQGQPLPENILLIAVSTNSLKCLKYAHEQGSNWIGTEAFIAEEFCYSDCLKYAHEHGCPWVVSTTHCPAIKKLDLDCFRYCILNNLGNVFYKIDWISPEQINDVDLDDYVWRDIFLKKIRSPIPEGCFCHSSIINDKINNKKKEIHEKQLLCYDLPLSKDVVSYVLCPYI